MPALAFLSACRTADGHLADGEGIISLARGFNALGTPATIASLWNVNDDAVADITLSFYAHLLAGQPSNQALHLSKLDWLSSAQNSEIYYLPYYWDSLIYMGADQKIAIQPPTNWLMIITITLLTVFVLAGMYITYKTRAKRISSPPYI